MFHGNIKPLLHLEHHKAWQKNDFSFEPHTWFSGKKFPPRLFLKAYAMYTHRAPSCAEIPSKKNFGPHVGFLGIAQIIEKMCSSFQFSFLASQTFDI